MNCWARVGADFDEARISSEEVANYLWFAGLDTNRRNATRRGLPTPLALLRSGVAVLFAIAT
jgi:hypothetical protein